MDVTSVAFIGFTLACAAVYQLSSARTWRQSVLLLANLGFLLSLSHDWKSYLPLIGFLALGYVAVWIVQRRDSSALFAMLAGATILLFLYLKQYRFVPPSLFLHHPYLTVGLSYIFFRVLQMIVDAHGGTLTEPVSPVAYINYTLNFTSLIAGPIQSYSDYASSQLAPERPPLTFNWLAEAAERVAIGFFKVRVLSMFALAAHGAAVRDLSAAEPSGSRLLAALSIVVIYPVYLYFNFSGYCDIMIGLARFLRLELPENFDRPFSSTSFLEFWSRWHITLSGWLKTYVYTPVLKTLMRRFPSNAVEPFLGVFAFFVTFFLVGAWHGQTAEFLFFGLLQGLGVSLNKLYQVLMVKFTGRKRYKAVCVNPFYRAFARGLTFTFFALSLLWFWSSWTQLHQLAGALSLKKSAVLWVGIWIGSTIVLALLESVREWSLAVRWRGEPLLQAAPLRAAWACYLMAITAVVLNSVRVPTPVLYRIF